MKLTKQCCCLYASLTAVLAILLLTYVFHGYGIREWNRLTWIAVIIVILTSIVCVRCSSSGASCENHPKDRR